MRERVAIAVAGIVQGVGFRPYVHALASRLALGGFVRNEAGTVLIEVEGDPTAVERFLIDLVNEAPPLARIDRVTSSQRTVCNEIEFRITASTSGPGGAVFISPDMATCTACLAELFDPTDRRHGYPFLNCTNCGPRLTIITGAPYDRANTTMAAFRMCGACRAEYDDPGDRRFHAQPTACPACGPRLRLLDSSGTPQGANPLPAFVAALWKGQIGALKGLGGYHLACDAQNDNAVRRLRARKHRDEKPFAVMVTDTDTAAGLCAISDEERALLESPRRPVVLLRRHAANGIAPGVAPGNPFLGVMLPYTPLHHLLLREFGGPLVMTSGNRSDEPIATDDTDAVERLGGIADLFLTHDRPIRVRCDDSVTRVIGGGESPVRRSRGYAPEPIRVPFGCPRPILAVGGQVKATFSLGRGLHAFLSHHLGDLDHLAAFAAFERDVALYEELLGIAPEVIAHDLHPDYPTTQYALKRTAASGMRLVAVQHHHAHIAAGMAEHGLTGPVIGVAFDGTGYGLDGAIWGGEILIADYRQFKRVGHLRYVRMPGADAAVRAPWRMALAHLIDAECDWPRPETRPRAAEERVVRRMLERRLNAPATSSIGRLFDAVASLAGVRQESSYEGQAAVELEWLASNAPADGVYPFEIGDGVIDTRPLIRAVTRDAAGGISAPIIARRFHSTLVDLIATVCERVRTELGLCEVVLSGGVFLNSLLSVGAAERLKGAGFRVYRHERVPTNDGGLSLGQLAVAAHLLTTE